MVKSSNEKGTKTPMQDKGHDARGRDNGEK